MKEKDEQLIEAYEKTTEERRKIINTILGINNTNIYFYKDFIDKKGEQYAD